MNPIDFRNANFEQLKGRLVKKREAVWLDWTAYEIRHGTAGATTREVCLWAGRDILQFRPRCTELFQMGLLKLAGEAAGPEAGAPDRKSEIVNRKSKEGIYVLRTMPEWEQWHAEQFALATSRQQQLI